MAGKLPDYLPDKRHIESRVSQVEVYKSFLFTIHSSPILCIRLAWSILAFIDLCRQLHHGPFIYRIGAFAAPGSAPVSFAKLYRPQSVRRLKLDNYLLKSAMSFILQILLSLTLAVFITSAMERLLIAGMGRIPSAGHWFVLCQRFFIAVFDNKKECSD